LSAERQKEIKETILNSETLCARDFMRQMTI